MTIQDIEVSNNIRKKIITAVRDEASIVVEENGDVIISVRRITFLQKVSNVHHYLKF